MPSALRAYTARGGSSGRDSVITRNQLVDERPGPLFWPRAATVILMNKLSFGTTSPTRRSAGARLSCGTAGPGSTGHYCRAVCPVPRACRQPARQRASEPSGIRPPGPRLAVDGGPVLRGALPSGCSACMLAARRRPPRDLLEGIFDLLEDIHETSLPILHPARRMQFSLCKARFFKFLRVVTRTI